MFQNRVFTFCYLGNNHRNQGISDSAPTTLLVSSVFMYSSCVILFILKYSLNEKGRTKVLTALPRSSEGNLSSDNSEVEPVIEDLISSFVKEGFLAIWTIQEKSALHRWRSRGLWPYLVCRFGIWLLLYAVTIVYCYAYKIYVFAVWWNTLLFFSTSRLLLL